ncbi:tetratricopeptide repeat protein [Desulfonema magnum]|uniref:Tetratricopeptide repeat-containing protein n=1 Tax=Desulfonema magnum TaxID=45655 RepID=A0A975GSL1_9BACT|nr:tetratricopeptide repeat protein [Desulfonema magnum]QTA92022.1 Tetratricopeptide repeat-containing protein [Desulfonema magnum]
MINKEDGFDLHINWHFPEAKRYGFTFIILFVSLIIIYGNSFHCEFHFDDFPNIVDNPNIHLKSLSWENIRKTFYGTYYNQEKILRPFSFLTLAFNYYIGGHNVFGYHVVNFAIHYVASVFLFLFIYNTLKLPLIRGEYEKSAYATALLAVFIWATHPIQLTAVTYIVQRMASLAGVFYIMAMYFYLKGRICDNRNRKIKFLILCGVAALLACASKENAAMLPVSLFLYDLFLIQGVTKEKLKRNLRVMLVSVLIFVLAGVLYSDFSSLLNLYENRQFTFIERLLTEPRVILFYITLLFYPIDSRLTLLHDIEISKSVFVPWTTLPAITIILILIGTALCISRKKPFIAYCILFFFLNHLIEGSVIPLELIYEHRNYLPSMLFIVPLAIFMIRVLDYFSYKKSIQFLMAFGFTFVLFSQAHTTYSRNMIFQNEFTLWTDNIAKSPELSRPYNNLGTEYWKLGLHSKAFEEMQKALEMKNVSNIKATAIYHENIGMYYLKKKDYDQAKHHFLTGTEICKGNPHPRTLYGLAMVYYKEGNLAESQKLIEKAILSKPSELQYHLILSLLLLKSGDVGEAVTGANYILRMDPDYAFSLMILAEAMKIKGRYDAAILYWERFLKKYPRYLTGHLALIELLSMTGEKEKLNIVLGRIMYLKGKKSYLEIIYEGTDDDIVVYEPEPDILLPIISKGLADQSNEITNSNSDG